MSALEIQHCPQMKKQIGESETDCGKDAEIINNSKRKEWLFFKARMHCQA